MPDLPASELTPLLPRPSNPSPTPRRTSAPASTLSRHCRGNVLLGYVLPPLIGTLVWKGSRLVILETGYGFLIRTRGSVIYGIAYLFFFSALLVPLIYSFLNVYLAPRSHSAPPRDPPPQVLARRAVYECDTTGAPLRCFRDGCNGSWKAFKTRHCSDCQICRREFDHHCAFIAGCVSASTLKSFVCFLYCVPPLVGVAIVPLIPLQMRAVQEVVSATWDTEWMRKHWWSRWYSWLGGPIWRYSTALLLGYHRYSSIYPPPHPILPPIMSEDGTTYSPCPALAEPRLSTLLIVVSGAFVWGVALAMIITTVRNARNGLSTVQVERIRRWRIEQQKNAKRDQPSWDARIRLWVPLDSSLASEGGAIIQVDPGLPLFDFGTAANWRRLMGEKWWDWFTPWPTGVGNVTGDENEINPQLLSLFKDEAMKRVA